MKYPSINIVNNLEDKDMEQRIDFGSTVTLQQAVKTIVATPKNRYNVVGEPGTGKSSIVKMLQAITQYPVSMVDVPNLDLGDTAMPVIDHETKTTHYYPNARFKIHLNEPVIICLDEFTKGAEPVKNMLHPMLEVNMPRLGDVSIHPDSLVFMTGNLGSDNVGDSLKAHSRNRIIELHVSKPTADEWLLWATDNAIAPVVMAWVQRTPHALASYLDGDQEQNPYIFNPKRVQKAFVSPRSLERVSYIVTARKKIGDDDAFIHAMTGAVGEAAARDLQAFVEYQDQLPAWESILKTPATAEVPVDAGACAVLLYGAVMRIDRAAMTPFFTYLKRFPEEWQHVFCTTMAKSNKKEIAFTHKEFAKWCLDNEDLL